MSQFQVVFEGIRGSGYQGDIAIDDVELKDNVCPPPGDCNFETGTCNWVNVQNTDNFDWLRGRGSTLSSFTGPSVDHTTNSSSGMFISHKIIKFWSTLASWAFGIMRPEIQQIRCTFCKRQEVCLKHNSPF